MNTSHALDLEGVLEIANIVVDVNSAVWRSKKDGSAIGRPLDNFKVDWKFFAPESGSFDTTNDDGAIFINDTNFLTVWGPLHVGNDTLVSVVDHFFEPMLLVHHPNDNKTLLIGGRELLILVIPLDNLDLAGVSLQRLIHTEVSSTLSFARVELENLEEALVTTDSDVALLLIPCDLVHRCVDTNLFTQIREHIECLKKFKFLNSY